MSAAADVSCKQPAGVLKPLINLQRCEGKGDCLDVCPENVFECASSILPTLPH